MAMGAKAAAVHEEDSSSDKEEEVVEEEEEGERAALEEELRALRARISQSSSYPLSDEALEVLHTALLSLDKQSKLPHTSLLSPLLLQLQSLRALIPPSQGDEGSTSCVITSALDYLEQLSRLIQNLKEALQISNSGGAYKNYAGLVKVERIGNAKLHLLVRCKKREGLLSSLILAFDTLGLVVEQMNIPRGDVFMVDVIATQVDENSIDDESVKEALWKIIHEDL